MTCPSGTIEILDANWGRTDESICRGWGFGSTMDDSCRKDVTSQMVEVCDGKSRCNEGGGSWSTAGRNNQPVDFGDPCFGIWKYVNVTYLCRSTLPAGGYVAKL